MCGGHGIHHILDLVASDTSRARDVQHHSGEHGNSSAVMEHEVKLMYARGEIGAEAFHHLLDLARAGDLESSDLIAFQSHRVDIPLSPQLGQCPYQGSTPTHPDQLQRQRSQLEAACAETEESIRRLRLEAAQLYQHAKAAEIASRNASLGSETAQTQSCTREESLARARTVEGRIQHIAARLSDLKTQLGVLAFEEKMAQRTI